MQVVVLSARTGWQTDELCRALSERGHLGVVVPYDGLLARCGPARGELTTGTPESSTQCSASTR